MKFIKTTLFIISLFFIVSCSDKKDEKDGLSLSPDFLKTGSWEGGFSNDDYSFDVTFLFINDKKGTLTITENDTKDYEFSYRVYDENRILHLVPSGTIQLNGDWILYEIEENRLLFRQNHYVGNEGSILEIKRVNL